MPAPCPALSLARRIALLALCALAAIRPAPGAAGAWPREKGRSFLSVASRISGPGWNGPYSYYSTTYFELGLGRRITAGFDIGHGISGLGKAVFFLRKSLPQSPRGHVFAGELGLGLIAGEPAIRPGFSWGKAITRRGGGSGWLSLESMAEIRLESRRTDLKADFTLGLNHGPRVKSLFQLQTGVSQGDPSFIRAAPSVVMKLGARAHVELGVAAGIVGDTSYGVKLGFWRDF